jgi:hypothetical protein
MLPRETWPLICRNPECPAPIRLRAIEPASGCIGFAAAIRDEAVSVILRIVFLFAGLLVATFVARDTLGFEIAQTFLAILLVAIVVGIGSVVVSRRRS